MRYDELRRRSAARVRDLDARIGLPVPFDLDVLLDRLERDRGRPIRLQPTAHVAGGTCGMWIAERDRDVIAYATQTSSLHQDHIILHEIGHMISEHQGECLLTVGDAQRLAPHVRPELIKHLFGRSAYSSTEEQEAEMIACLIMQHAEQRRSQLTDRPLPPDLAARLARVEDIFGP
ncbi:hypothetical protein GCM10012275_35200 [Longimycelium tulufanense]|uniref:IrrE N-terminal-like domain-containing protein n=1 Tax=Longimycelium tulufanense TaxID=907463 RepID=A0A8J3CG01_9PSEU|nr:hypothetical protein [Longimycelium tulufanense]GGM61098.1 hypothetical protein GCM10012275_35200 [Longimycelium tulufanense]